MSNKLMSIIMLNFNRLHYSKPTLERIIKNTTMRHEIIFVDNGSVDGTREYLKSMEHKTNAERIVYVFNQKNMGVAGGRNSGLVKASKDYSYLTTIDDDILVPPRWDVLMAEALDKVPGIGITGVNVEPFKFPVRIINGARVRPKNGNLGGGCLCIPRRVFVSIGYYNYFSVYGHEDCAYYYRLKQIGLSSAYIEPKGIHIDVDADLDYRKAKNNAHKKKSIQLCALAGYLSEMRTTGNVYVPFDPDYNPPDTDIFTTDLIMKNRKDKG